MTTVRQQQVAPGDLEEGLVADPAEVLPLLFVDLADVPGPPIELRKHPVAFLAGKLATGWKWNQIYQLQTSN